MSGPPGKRRFAAIVAALLAGMFIVMLTSSLQENDAYDEGGHLTAGYARLRLGYYGFNTEHPPLGNALSALPLLPLNPRLATEHPSWRESAAPIAGALFLYRNRVRPETLLLLGRLPTMVLTLVLGVVLAVWTQARFGPSAALLAVFLYTTDPNIIAHGHYITTDLIAALFIFASCISWERYLGTGKWLDLALASLLFGLALLSKFSTLFLYPVSVLLYVLAKPLEWRRLIVSMTILTLISAIIIGIGYWPETKRVLSGELPVSRHAYLAGLDLVRQHSSGGHPSYLLGQNSDAGWWYYFPVVFAVKTPTVLLVLTLILAPLGVRQALRKRQPVWYVLIVPPAFYFALSMSSKINLGVRHLLPIYPFMIVFVSALLFKLKAALPRRAMSGVLLTLVAVQIFESARAFPDYLAFFNTVAGGSAGGDRYLVDSNLDWGQGIKRLKKYLDAHGTNEVCLDYFGTTDVAYYGVHRRHLPFTWELEERQKIDCVAAVSATLLHDVYVKPGSYSWLREKAPDARVGYSIFVYDLRKPQVPTP